VIALLSVLLAGATSAWGSGPVSARLRESIDAFVRERSPIPLDVVRIPVLRDFEIPGFDPAAVDISLSVNPRERFTGSVPITALLEVGGVPVKRGVITVRVETLAPVLVAVRRLARGTEILDSDLRIETRNLANLPRRRLTERSQAVGKQAARSIPEGALLSESMLTMLPAVKRGQIVPLRFERNGLRIEARARAKEDGQTGDRIRVVAEWTRREISGRVSEDGAVHVGF
jgi:flagella basal body P-ring formation protein FlgA